jgi:CspA family cold shock protein
MLEGSVKTWNSARGFGFVRGDDGAELFCHISRVLSDVASLSPGDRVQYTVGPNPKSGKPECKQVTVKDAPRAAGRAEAWWADRERG